MIRLDDIESVKHTIPITVGNYFVVKGKITIEDDFEIIDDYPIFKINVNGSVSARHIITRLNQKLPFKFNKVTGPMFVNPGFMDNLYNFPIEVTGTFNVFANNLTSLQGCPQNIGGTFRCNGNQLTSLKYGPNYVGGDYVVCENPITSLEGCPNYVGGDFNLTNCKELKVLDYLPETIRGRLHVNYHRDLPLLKAMKYSIRMPGAKAELMAVVQRHHKSTPTRSNILACQKELIDVGFESNAKW